MSKVSYNFMQLLCTKCNFDYYFPGINNLRSVISMRSKKEYLDIKDVESENIKSTYSIPHSKYVDGRFNPDFEFLYSEKCLLNSSTNTTVSSMDLATLVSTFRTIIPPPDQFDKSFRNPCWYMHLNLPLKVNKILQSTRGNISDAEASNLMNMVFSNSPQQNDGDGKSSPNLSPQKSLVCVPPVYFIGFPRSGSTQLYKMLISHPDLAGGLNKEPHWWTRYMFSSRFPHNILSVIRYLSHFREVTEGMANHTQKLLIDGSQSTVWDVRMTNNLCALPRLITSIVPNAKFIVLMRNPVDRLFSDFRYLCEEAIRVKLKNKLSNGTQNNSGNSSQLLSFNVSADVFHDVVKREIATFDRCLESGSTLDFCTYLLTVPLPRKSTPGAISNECSRVRLGISLYHVHLKRWLNVIPKKRMLFLKTEEMSSDPYALLERVWQFLDVGRQSKDELNEILYKHSHPSGNSTMGGGGAMEDADMHQRTRELLNEFFKPHNAILSHLLKEEEDEFNWIDDG